MIRQQILQLLNNYSSQDAHESVMIENTISFIEQHADCFERSLLAGHVTASAWILNEERTHVLLLHHKKLDKWLQPGGHCDGDPDVMAVAAKESFEETGMRVNCIDTSIFDVDHHTIPERKGVPEHIHYDIRFLFEATKVSDELPSNEEANAVKWIALKDVHLYNNSPSVMRLVEKVMR